MSAETSQSYLPLPEISDQISFRQKSFNDSLRARRPPKLFQKSHESSYHNRSVNQSNLPHLISFKDSTIHGSPIQNSTYVPSKKETFFEQCFETIAKLGEGSFGEVFKVRSKEDGRLYAIKKSINWYRGESYRQERLEEVRHYEQFSQHEHCITLYRAWEQYDLLYMQLELCKGSLESLANSAVPESRLWEILVDLLLGLKALHDQNHIHLDIKLDNVMIDENNVCKLGDFGLVIDLKRPNLQHAQEGDSRYMAPEILKSGQFTKAADIFSLGITMLELAYNLELPNNGRLWHVLRSGALPDEFFTQLSKDLQNIIKLMMHPDHQKRPDVNELLAFTRIETVLNRRNSFFKGTKVQQSISNLLLILHQTFYNFLSKFFSIFKLKRKEGITFAETSTPQSTKFQPATDDSFFLLEDSEIDFEESPNVKKLKQGYASTPDIHIVNSTPLNHYNSGARRPRGEISRTSLVFSDDDNDDEMDNTGNQNADCSNQLSRHAFDRRQNDEPSAPSFNFKKLFPNLDTSEL